MHRLLNSRNLVLSFLTLFFVFYGLFYFTEPRNSSTQEDSWVEVNDEVVHSNLQSKTEYEKNEINKKNGQGLDVDNLSTKESGTQITCFNLSELDKDYHRNIVTEFVNEYVLFPNAVDQYLTELEEEELISELEAGNASAAYVLGMNYFYSSYNTSWFNPYLRNGQRIQGDRSADFDKSAINIAREWLWLASLNNISTALIELSNTYRIESAFLEKTLVSSSIEETTVYDDRINVLKAKELSFKILFSEVASDSRAVFGSPISNYNLQFDKLDLEIKNDIYNSIKNKWIDKRKEIGRLSSIELTVPEKVNSSLFKMKNLCR